MSSTSTSRVLRKYGILVEDIDGYVGDLERVPHAKPNETFKQWKERLFNDSVPDMAIYMPCIPAQQTRMSTLKDLCSGEHILDAMKEYRALSDRDIQSVLEDASTSIKQLDETNKQLKKAQEQLDKAQDEIKTLTSERDKNRAAEDTIRKQDAELRAIKTVPIDVLEDIVEEKLEDLEPSVREYMDRFLESGKQELSTEQIITGLLNNYNKAVKQYRKLDPDLR